MARRPKDFVFRLRRPKPPGNEITGDTFLIVVEGEGTEVDYFTGLRDKVLRRPTFQVEVHHPPVTDPVRLVHAAIESRAARLLAAQEGLGVIYDQVWVLMDRERQHCERREQIPAARKLAEANKIFIAVSNPCFELWLMLHYRDRPGPFRDGAQCRKVLKKDHILNYRKRLTPEMLDDLLQRESLKKAVKHGRQCEQYHAAGKGDGNPSSEVYRLLVALNTSVPRGRRMF